MVLKNLKRFIFEKWKFIRKIKCVKVIVSKFGGCRSILRRRELVGEVGGILKRINFVKMFNLYF